MKKLACSLLTIIILFTISCEIGLGSSVDTEPPSLGISADIVDTTIAGDFNIEGTYSDDGNIAGITAVLKRTDGIGSEIEVDGILQEDLTKRGSGTWKVPVNSKSDDRFVDGSYQAIVSIKDAMGRITSQSTTFTIDNTPPVLILTKPKSKPGDETVSSYGQRIFLEGSIADSAKETRITVEFYDNENCIGDPLTKIETGAISPTDVNSNNARLAVYADSEDTEKLYDKIYNPTQADGKEGSKDIYIKITSSDIAGNETTDFYFSKDLGENLTKDKKSNGYGLAPIDIYTILNGTDNLKNTVRSAADVTAIKSLLAENKKEIAVFSLNPANSPYFTIAGMKTITGNNDFDSSEKGYFVINGAQTLEISVFMGSDSIELVDDKPNTPVDEREFYAYVLECNDNGQPIDENGTILEEGEEEYRIKLYSKSKETGTGSDKKTYYSIGGKQEHKTTSGAYVFTIPMSETIIPDPDIIESETGAVKRVETGLKVGKNYRIYVHGKDNENNEIESYETGYGFHFSSGGGAPTLEVEEPSDTTAIYKKGDKVIFKGTVKSGEGIPEVTLWKSEKGKEDEKIADISLKTENAGEENPFEYEIPDNVFNQDTSKTYSIKIMASRGEGVTTLPYSIWYDVKGPAITINSKQPVVTVKKADNTSEECINGIFTVKGTIIDDIDQVDTAVWKIKQGDNVISGVGENLENSFEFSVDTNLKNEAGELLISDNENITIIIEAKDRAGNVNTESLTYKVDQRTDKPSITNSSDVLDITKGTNESIFDQSMNMFVRGSSLVLGVSDDDGVKEAEVMLQLKDSDGNFAQVNKSDDSETYSKWTNPSVITHTIPTEVGVYKVTVIAKDKYFDTTATTPYNYTEVTFMIKVTGTGPDVTITPEKDYVSTLNADATNKLTFKVNGATTTDKFKLYKVVNGQPVLQKTVDNKEERTSPFDYILEFNQGETPSDEITFRITDANGFTNKIFTPKFDNDLPTVSINEFPALIEDTYLFKGTMSDETSGIDSVKIKINNGDWVDCTCGSTTWNHEASFTTEGLKTVTVKAIDEAGNEYTAPSQTFIYDTSKPNLLVDSLTEDKTNIISDEVSSSGYMLTGTVTDSNALAENNALVVIVDGVQSLVTPDSDSHWTFEIAKGTATGKLKSDASVNVEVIAKDVADKTTSKNFIVYYDTKKPELEVTSPASEEPVETAEKAIKGTVRDEGYGVDKVEYTLYKGDVTDTTINPEVIQVNGTAVTSENYPVTLKGEQWYIADTVNGGKIPLGELQGPLTLKVTATEKKNGTHGGRTTTQFVTFYYDVANPSLKETAIGTTGKTTNEEFSLSGKVWDSNAISEIEIICDSHEDRWISGNPSVANITLTPTTSEPIANNWTASFVVGSDNSSQPHYMEDGTHDLKIIARDISGKETQLTRVVTVDTTNPQVSDITVITDSQFANGSVSWYDTRTLSVEVNVTDTINGVAGAGISKVEYTTETGSNATWAPLSSRDGKYVGSITFANDGVNQKIRVKATDVAGNESAILEKTVSIDTTAPELNAMLYKKGTNGSITTIGGTVCTQNNTSLTFYGNYTDPQSGVYPLTFKFNDDEIESTSINVTYSTTAINGSNASAVDTLSYVAYDAQTVTAPTTYKSWKAVFTPTASGTLSVSGSNRADNPTSEIKIIDITCDTEAPVFSNEKLEEMTGTTDSTKKEVYYKDSNSKYYTNNSGKTYVLSGVAADDVGIESVTLQVANTATTSPATTLTPDMATGATLSKWKFEFEMPDWQTGATATVTVTDKAGRSTNSIYNIVFDTEAPSAKHAVDAKGKDLYFRIGNYDNDDIATTDSMWSNTLDKDSGAKYAGGTYGNAYTINIRGNFDDGEGSDLKAIWYKVYGTDSSVLFANNGNEYDLTDAQLNALISDVVTSGKSFAPLSSVETKRVFYNVSKEANAENYGGTLLGSESDYTTSSYYKYYKDIESNYKVSLSDFKEGRNFLVLVAEDNAGNRKLDAASVAIQDEATGQTFVHTFPCFSLNVDTNPPTITQPSDMSIKYTNGGPLILGVSVADNPKAGTEESSGVDSVKFTYEDNGTKTVNAVYNDTTHKYEVDIGNELVNKTSGTFTISAIATDKAGTGNTSTLIVGTIMIDKEGPQLRINSPAAGSSVGTTLTISGTASDGNGAGLSSKTSDKITLYATKTANLSTASTDFSSTTSATAAETKWVKLGEVATTAEWVFTGIDISDLGITDGENTPFYFMVSGKDDAGTGNLGYSPTRNVIVDRKLPVIQEEPEFTANGSEAWINSNTITLAGSFTDPATVTGDTAILGSGVNTIYYLVGDDINNKVGIPTTDGTFNTNISLGTSGEGVHLHIWAKDKAGNSLTALPSANTANYKMYTFKVDSNPPTIDESKYFKKGSEAIASVDGTVYIKSQTGGTNFVLYGNYADGNTESGVTALTIKNGTTTIDASDITYSESVLPATASDIDNDSYDEYDASKAGSYKSWKAEFNVNASGRITVEGGDKAGNRTTTITALDIAVDKTAPVISNVNFTETTSTVTKDVYSTTVDSNVTYFTNNTVSGRTFAISGIATDNVGVQSITLDVVNSASSTTALESQPINNPSGNWSFTVGNWSAWSTGATATVTVTDKAGNEATTNLNIQFDTTAPAISTLKINNATVASNADMANTWYKSQIIPLSVAVTEADSGVASVEWATQTNEETAALTTSDWTALTTIDNDGNYTGSAIFDTIGTGQKLYIRVTDKAGNVSYFKDDNAAVTINIDTTAPSVTPPSITSFATNGSGDDITVTGTASDAESGLDNIVVTVGGTDFSQTITAFTGSGTEKSWTATIPADTFGNGTTGDFTIYAKATNKAGLAGSQISVGTINVDTASPTITITSPVVDAKVAGTFAISGTATDGAGSGLSNDENDKIILYYTTKEELGTVATAPTSVTAGTNVTTSWVVLDGSLSTSSAWEKSNTISTDVAENGANTDVYVMASVKDNAGNIGYSVPRKVTVDRKMPEVGNQPSGFGDGSAWVNRSTIAFTGSFTDAGGSGANTIYYLIGDVIGEVGGVNHQPKAIPTTNGSYDTNITVDTNGENVHVHIWAEDKAGNNFINTITAVENVKTLPTTDSVNHKMYTVKLDASAPTLKSMFFKKGENGALTATSDSAYVTGNTTITLYGNYKDGANESGVDELTFKNNGTAFASNAITVTYSTTEITDKTSITGATFAEYAVANKTAYKSWKAVFNVGSDNCRITAEGKDIAGNAVAETVLDIKVDTAAPVVTITSPTGNTTKTGYDSLTIGGTVSDGTGSGLSNDDIKVYYTKDSTEGSATSITTLNTSKWTHFGTMSSVAAWTFTNSNILGSITYPGTIAPDDANTNLYFTVEAKDKAGNIGYSAPRKITVDRKAPTFVSGTVGGNASGWFNNRTVNINGSFTDDGEIGSGVSYIKYEYQIGSDTISNSLPTTDGSYNTNITLNNNVTSTTLKIWAIDAAGNEIPSTDTTNYKTYTLNLDTNEPRVEEWVAGDRTEGYFNDSTLTNRSASETFYFYVTDVFGESGIDTDDPAISVKVGSRTITFGEHGSSIDLGDIETGTAATANAAGTPNKWPVTIVIGQEDIATLTGNNTVLVTATDQAGNIGLATSVGSLSVDIIPPTITVKDLEDKNTSADGTYINGKVSITGSISEANLYEESGTEKTMKLYYTREASLATTAANIGTTPDSKWVEIGTAAHGNTWTFTDVNTTTLEKTYGANEAHRTTVYFMVSANDKAGNTGYSTPKTVIIDQDTDRPVITLSQIERKTDTVETTLKTNNVYGSITDDDGNVNKLWYKFGTAPTSLPTLSGTTWTATGWIEIPVNGSSWSIESDENDGETTWYFAVADAQNKVFATKGTDKFVQPYIKYLNDTNKYDGTSAGISFKYDTNPPSASYLGLYRVETPGSSTTLASASEIADDSTITWLTDNDIAFGGDYNVLYAKVVVSESTGMKALTGSGTTAPTSSPIAINYTNSSGANPLTFDKIHQVIGEDEDAGTYTYYLGPIIMDTSNKPEFKVTVTDAVGNNGYISRNIIVDNTAPNTIRDAKPNSSVEQTGTFTYRGNVYDKDNNTGSELSGIEKIEWYIPKSSETSATASGITWTEASYTAGWEIDFSGNNTLSTLIDYDVSGDTSHVGDDYTAYQTTSTSGIYLVPVWFKITDKVGNVGYNTTNKIRYNPNTDRPSVRITSPEHNMQATINGNTIDYAIMGGASARISGSADDDEGIGKVYLQFDLNGDGIWDNGISGYNAETATAKPASTATRIDGCPWAVSDIKAITYKNANGTHTWGYGIEVGSSKNWSYTVNLSSIALLHITETETNGVYTYSGNTIKVRAIVVDNDEVNGQLVSAPSDVINISVNNNIPLFSNLKLKQYNGTNVVTELDYTLGKYLKGENWFITADVQSAGGIDTASYTGTTSADGNAAKSCFTAKTGSTNQFDMKIPVVPNNNGEWSVTIIVRDGSDDHNPNNQTITVNVDNTAPSFNDTYSNTEDIATYGTAKHYLGGYGTRGTLLTPTSKIADSDGRASIWGKVSDSGSGFEKAVFYFKRFDQNGTDNPRVYNPMEANRADIVATKTVGKVYINAEALPALYVKSDTTAGLTVSRPDVNKIKVEKDDDAPDGILGVVGNTNVHKGGLIKIGGVYRTIIDVASDGTITWPMSSSCDTSFVEAEIIYAMVLDSTGETMTGDTINEEDDDGMMENFTTSGAVTTWNAALPTSNIPDGTIELHVVVFDVAGNSDHAYTKTGIENNPLRLTKVMLGTDLNGNGSYGTNEYESYYAITSNSGTHTLSSGKQVWNLETRSDEHDPYFTVKSGLSVIPEFVGGTGDVYYKFKKTAASATNPNLTAAETLTASTSNKLSTTGLTAEGTDNKIGKFELDNTAIGTGGDDTDYVFSFSFWDSTESSTPGTNSSWTVLNAKVHQDLADGVNPAGDITPFYWESKTVNSVVWSTGSNPVAQGHIELENDLPTATFASTSTSGEYDRDPKVSGKIKVEGYAYDDTRLGSITVAFANKTATANYGTSGWTNSTSDSDYTLTVDDTTGPTQNGHTVRWTLTVNTATVVTNAVAATDKTITVTVKDATDTNTSTSSTTATGKATESKAWSAVKAESCATSRYYTDVALTTLATNSTADNTPVYNNKTPYYKVDVVPYITGIKTTNRTKSGLKDNNIRSASGKYSIIYGRQVTETGRESNTLATNFITVNGFNLNPGDNDVRIVNETTKATTTVAAGTSGSGIKVTRTAANAARTSFTASNAISKSGYLEVFTNGVRSLNNINNDNAHDASGRGSQIGTTEDDWQNYYNREADYNSTKNVQLTDDRYLMMWDMQKTNTKNGYYPVMIMDGNDPVFGFVDSNGDSRGTITNGWANYYMPQRVKYSGSTGTASSYEYLCGATTWEQMAMAKDDSGRYVHTSVYNRTGGGMEFFYDRFGALQLKTNNTGKYYGWARGVIIGNDDDQDVRTSATGNTALCMDGLNYNGLLVDRYQAIKLIAKGNSKTSDGATIYQAYYDDNSTEVLFRNFKIGTSSDLGNSMTSGMRTNQKASDNQNFAQYTNLTEISANNKAAPGRNTVTSTGSKYYDFGITSGNIAVFVYYDFEEGRLRLMYSANSANANSTSKAVTGAPGTAVTFCENTNISLPDYVGQYVSMCIDSANHIHIAAFDANNSDLKYIYLDSFNATGYDDMTVDAAGSVGNWTSIKIDKTSSHPYYNKPIIAYYNATETGGRDTIKLAIANNVGGSVTDGIDPDTNYTSTGWEYMTVPSVDPAQGGNQKFQQVCLDFDSSGNPVVGYLATNLEFGKQLPEAD